jgi:esterase/lipase
MDMTVPLSRIEAVTQIQQGTADTYTPYEETAIVKEYLTGLRDFAVFEDGEHFLPDPVMRAQMVQNSVFFLDKHAYTLPPAKIKKVDKTKIIRNME